MSKIQRPNLTANPISGNGLHFDGANQDRPEMTLNVDMINKWSKMRKPKKIFVGSMTDVFGPWVPDWMIFALFDGMAQATRQTFQLLTKRPERMSAAVCDWLRQVGKGQLPKNIWLGTSAEDQKRLDDHLPWLNRTLAQVRFLSLEPLLGPIQMFDVDGAAARGMAEDNEHVLLWPVDMVDWVIIGGESGHAARPLKIKWVEDILRQCKGDNIPAFVKQLGTHWAKRTGAAHSKGGDPDGWPEQFRVRMFPEEAWKK